MEQVSNNSRDGFLVKIDAAAWTFAHFAKDCKGWTLREIMEKARISRTLIYRILKSMEIKQAISERVTDENSDWTPLKIIAENRYGSLLRQSATKIVDSLNWEDNN